MNATSNYKDSNDEIILFSITVFSSSKNWISKQCSIVYEQINYIDHRKTPINMSHRLRRFVLFCYERDFMMFLSDDTQAEIIDAFDSTSRYLDDIDNPYFALKEWSLKYIANS